MAGRQADQAVSAIMLVQIKQWHEQGRVIQGWLIFPTCQNEEETEICASSCINGIRTHEHTTCDVT
jgi:hypothetical protein